MDLHFRFCKKYSARDLCCLRGSESEMCRGGVGTEAHTETHKDCSCNSETGEEPCGAAGVSPSGGSSSNRPKMSSFQHPRGSAGFLEVTPRRDQVQDVQICPFWFTKAALAQGSLTHTTLLSAFIPLARPLLFTLSCDNAQLPGSPPSPNCKAKSLWQGAHVLGWGQLSLGAPILGRGARRPLLEKSYM